jgi:2-amino-4-hydroxy-6-hydroxymethyldihydropteridine diphosphokinase
MSSLRNITLGSETSPTVIVGLGSNLDTRLGSPAQTIELAIERLAEFSVNDLIASSIWQTAPVDCPPESADFSNAICIFTSLAELSPEELLVELKKIEVEFGRTQNSRANAPRELDLDLICFGNCTRQTETLKLPHPRAFQREFVLAPLAELAPNLIIPLQSLTVLELLELLQNTKNGVSRF